MGTFEGHAIPGTFFITIGVWWTVQIYRQYCRSFRKGGKAFRSSVTFKVDCLEGRAQRIDWEGLVIVIFATFGLTLELATGERDEHGKLIDLESGHHATMFGAFALSGIVDIIVCLQPTLLPRSTEYLTGILAYTVEWLIFKFHTHGRTALNKLVHELLGYVVALCIITLLLEMKYRRNVLIPLMRAFALILQGTWFWHAAFILFNPNPNAAPWDEEGHKDMMIVTMFFAWHVEAIFVFILVVGLAMRLVELGRHGNEKAYSRVRVLSSSDRE